MVQPVEEFVGRLQSPVLHHHVEITVKFRNGIVTLESAKQAGGKMRNERLLFYTNQNPHRVRRSSRNRPTPARNEDFREMVVFWTPVALLWPTGTWVLVSDETAPAAERVGWKQ